MLSPAQYLATLERRLAKLEANRGLVDTALDAAQLAIRDPDGNTMAILGLLDDGTYGLQYLAGPIPPTPAAPTAVGVAGGGATVSWSGATETGAPWPTDAEYVRVEISTDAQFGAGTVATAGTMRIISNPVQLTISGLTPGQQTWIGLRAVTRSGMTSPRSATVAVIPKAAVTSDQLTDYDQTIQSTLGQLAQNVAGVGKTYFNNLADGAPVPDGKPGDLWFRPDDGNAVYQWDPDRAVGDLKRWKKYPYGTSALLEGAITNTLLAKDAVTIEKLKDGAVTDVKIADGAISTPKLTVGAVTDNLAPNSNFEDWTTTTTPAGWRTWTGDDAAGATYGRATGAAALTGSFSGTMKPAAPAGTARVFQDRTIPVGEREKLYGAFRVKGSAYVESGAAVAFDWYNADGGWITVEQQIWDLPDFPQDLFCVATAPDGAVGARLSIRALSPAAAAGATLTYDTGVVRRLIGGAVIADAAITNAKIGNGEITAAKIGNAEIGDAKIASVSAAKLIAGTAIVGNLAVQSTLTLGSETTNGAIQSYGYTVNGGTGVYIDKSTVQINGGTLTGGVYSTSPQTTATNALTNHAQRIQIRPNSNGTGGVLEHWTGLAAAPTPGQLSMLVNTNTADGTYRARTRLTPANNGTDVPYIDLAGPPLDFTTGAGTALYGSYLRLRAGTVILTATDRVEVKSGATFSGYADFNGNVTMNGASVYASGAVTFNDLAKAGGGSRYVLATSSGLLAAYSSGPSSRTLKHDIRPLAEMFPDHRKLLEVEPVTFYFNDAPGLLRAGVIAEQVEEVGAEPWVGREDPDDPAKVTGFDYMGYVSALQLVCREQQKQIDALMERLDALTTRVEQAAT